MPTNRLGSIVIASLLVTPLASAQIISSAADNDMDPQYTSDGWRNVVGSYDVASFPGGFSGSPWLEPPDGNTYGGGVQYSGVPGTQEAIEKDITGLTPGVAYAIEWYIMSDRPQGSGTEEVWFDVRFCGGTPAETMHIPWTRRREWIREVQVFTATAATCLLRFSARNPSGNNSNWIFLDSVQVAVATSTDFAITATGPALVLPGSSADVNVTIQHNGPDPGTAPVVTYPLPSGASVNGGAAGAVTASGADGAAWTCTANGGTPQTIECRRMSAMSLGSMSAFTLAIDFDPAVGAALTSTLTVEPTFQAGNADPDPTNDTASFVTRPPVCGDGTLEGGEDCEDGNTMPDDGCSDRCTTEPGYMCPTLGALCVPVCGDGMVLSGEDCDDGNGVDDDGCTSCVTDDGWLCTGAPSVCDAAECGDGILAGSEGCDDDNLADGDGCSMTCTVETDFTCGGSPSVCVPGVCGDGMLATVEGCDDGNRDSGDGCSMGCAEEPGFSCSGEPSVCVTTCGDGVIRGDEACDDDNTTSGDGCSATCTVEDSYACTGEPSVCARTCGDGTIDAGEACDDDNAASGDGCSATCTVEDGYACTGEPSVCARTCGNGETDAGETCDDGNTESGDGCSATCQVETVSQCDGGPCVENPGRVVGGICGVATGRRDAPGALLLLGLAAVTWLGRRRRR